MRVGDGAQGWPEHASFDKILVGAAPELCPPVLIEQLRPEAAWSSPQASRATSG